jgi:hypothetical protein
MKCDLHLLECFNLYYFSWVWENANFSHILLDVQCTDLLIVFHIRSFSMFNLTSCSLQYIVNAIICTSILFYICFPGTISTSFLTLISSYIVYNVETKLYLRINVYHVQIIINIRTILRQQQKGRGEMIKRGHCSKVSSSLPLRGTGGPGWAWAQSDCVVFIGSLLVSVPNGTLLVFFT